MADQLQFTEEQIKEVLQRSYAMILQDCDGAISHDNVGFRANDSKFARRITSIPTDQWSQYLTWDAYITLNTYKKQLLDRHGIDYDLIPQPQKPDAENKNIRDLGRYEAYLSARKSVLSQRVGQSNTDNGQPSAKAQADYDAERDTFRVYFLDLKDAQFRNDFKNKVRGARYEAANKFWIVSKFFYHDLEAFANANKMTPDGSTGMVLTDEAKQAIEDFKGTVYNVQPIDIDTVGFYLGGYYHEPLVQVLRNLPGHKFVRGANQHNRAKPVVQAVEIAKRFNLTVHPSTFDLIEWHQSDRMARRFAKQKEDADREIALADHLRPFQRVGAEEAIKRKHILLGDCRGLGKTRTAISAIETWRRYPAVVVCPPSATGNWVREIQALLPDDEIYVCSGRSGKLVVSDWIIVPYSVAPNWLPELYPAQALVCDESHYLKNSDANRTQAVREYRKRMHENSLIMLLSGTFLKSRPNELIEQFKILHPNYMREEFGGQENFFFRFCGGNDPNIKSENELELHQRLSETVLLRRTKEDVLPELPPKELRHLTFTLDSNKLKEYHRVERDFINWVTENYGREAADRASRAEAITRLNALRQLAGQAKIEEVVEWVEDFINGSDRDPSLIIFAHHKSVQDALTNTLRDRGHDVSVIVGGQKIDNLEREKEKFQNGETKIIVCSMEAGKESHTLTAANDVIFVEQPWTPSDLNQALDRAHRIGQVNAVTGYNFMAEDTIDIHMHNVITEKAQIVNAIQDGIPMDMEDHFSEFDIADEVIDRIVAR